MMDQKAITDEDIRLPNNRAAAMKRLESLKRKFEKDDLKLINRKLPTEIALGVHWNVEKDQLCYKLNRKDRNITRKGMLPTLRSFCDPSGLASTFVLKGSKIFVMRDCNWMKRYQKCIKRNGKARKKTLLV